MNKDIIYLKVAKELSIFSKCVSQQVACIAVKDDRILATGYNGTPSGYINCNEKFGQPFNRHDHHEWSLQHEIHAELNLILFCAKFGIGLNGATLYSTLQPCNDCSKNIIQSGIKRIVFSNKYDLLKDDQYTTNFLIENGVSTEYLPWD